MMRKTKRIGALLLTFLIAAAATSCGTNGENGSSAENNVQNETSSGSSAAGDTGERITLTYYCGLQAPDVYTSNAEMLCYQIASEKTGIDIEWIHPPKGQETEQFNLMIVSDDKPDIIESNWRTFSGGPDYAIETNVIQDITDAVAQYMPNFSAYLEKYPDLRQMVSSDQSRLYCVPYIFTNTPDSSSEWQSIMNREPIPETYVGIIMRGDWLEELGLEAPETIDEFINVLTAFKNEKGISAPFSTTTSFLKQSQIFASAYDVTSDGFIDVDGKAVFSPIQPAYKEYLTVLNRLYTEGLLDPDFAAQDQTTNQAKITSGDTGMWLGYYSSWLNAFYDQLHAEDPNTTFNPIGLANPLLTEGQQLTYRQADDSYRSQGAAISSSCENVEAALTYLDWAFTEEGDLAMNWGAEGDTFEWSEDGWPVLTDKVINDPDELGVATAITKYTRKNGPLGMDYYNRLILGESSGTEEGLKGLAVWNSERNGTRSATIPLTTATSEESARLSALSNEINTYVSESYVKFVMGEMSLEDFDSYVSTVESLGLAEYTELTQAGLDRYYNRQK